MKRISRCGMHNDPLEIYCETCKQFLCMKCLTTHEKGKIDHEYQHVMKYSKEKLLPLIEELLKKMGSSDFNPGDAKVLEDSFMKKIEKHGKDLEDIKNLVNNLTELIKPFQEKSYLDRITEERRNITEALEKAIEEKNTEKILKLSDEYDNISEKIKFDFDIKPINELNKIIKEIDYISLYKEACQNLEQISLKRRICYIYESFINWKLDRKFLCPKLTLAQDDLTLGINADEEHLAVIGDTPIESGLMIYEVTPIGLDCSGKEGFGAIELDKYMEIYDRGPTNPHCYSEMMGIFHGNECHNMTKNISVKMQNDSKYVAVLDLNNLEFKILGPDTEVSTNLQIGVAYVPCFSVGCTSNKLLQYSCYWILQKYQILGSKKEGYQ